MLDDTFTDVRPVRKTGGQAKPPYVAMLKDGRLIVSQAAVALLGEAEHVTVKYSKVKNAFAVQVAPSGFKVVAHKGQYVVNAGEALTNAGAVLEAGRHYQAQAIEGGLLVAI